MAERKIHCENNQRHDHRGYHHNHSAGLQLSKRRPCYFMYQLIVSFSEIRINLFHSVNLKTICNTSELEAVRRITLLLKANLRTVTYTNYCRGRAIRTPINGFGDRYSTLELCPCYPQIKICKVEVRENPHSYHTCFNLKSSSPVRRQPYGRLHE